MQDGYVDISNHCVTAVTCLGLDCLIEWEQATAWTVATAEVNGMRLPSQGPREVVSDRFVGGRYPAGNGCPVWLGQGGMLLWVTAMSRRLLVPPLKSVPPGVGVDGGSDR